MRRTSIATSLTAILGLAGVVAAPAASAAQGTRPCPSYYYCFYENPGYKGWHLNYNATMSGSFENPPYSAGDRRNQLSSIINNGNRTICIWNDLPGPWDRMMLRVAPYQDQKNLHDLGLADKADYWRVYNGNNAC